MLVTPEMAPKPEFMSFVRCVKAAEQLDCIVIGECNAQTTSSENTSSFRDV